MGNFIMWDAGNGQDRKVEGRRILRLERARSSRPAASPATDARGYVKCVDANDISKELYSSRTPSGIIGNLNTWEYKGKQYIGVLSGIGGWARHLVLLRASRRTPTA